MAKTVARILLIFTFAVLLGSMFFFWTNAVVDSSFYQAFATYIRTGHYPFSYPFIYTRPTTISAPLYSLFLIPIHQLLPRPDYAIHFIQICMLAASGFLVYKTLRLKLSPAISSIAACVFILIPGNIVYTTLIMTEIGSQLFLTLYLYMIAIFFVRKKNNYLFIAAFLGCVMGLWKYSMILYGAIALAGIVYIHPKIGRAYVWPVLGIITIGIWIIINHAITGVWGLSDTKGIDFYNQIVWYGHVAPSEDTPSMKVYRMYVPQPTAPYGGWWDYQMAISQGVGYDYAAMDKIFLNVAVDAIKQHPDVYIKTTLSNFITLHAGAMPYWGNMDSFGKQNADPFPPPCGPLDKFILCSPIIRTPDSFTYFNTFVSVSTWMYKHVAPYVSYLVFLPLLFYVLLFGSSFEKTIAFLHTVGVLSIAMSIHPDGRYLVPFYPLMTMICAFGVMGVYKRFLHKKLNVKIVQDGQTS